MVNERYISLAVEQYFSYSIGDLQFSFCQPILRLFVKSIFCCWVKIIFHTFANKIHFSGEWKLYFIHLPTKYILVVRWPRNQFSFCLHGTLRRQSSDYLIPRFYQILIPHLSFEIIHILKSTLFCVKISMFCVENILSPEISTFFPIVHAAVCAECDANLIRNSEEICFQRHFYSRASSRLRKLGFKCSGSHNSFQTVFTQSIEIRIQIYFGFICLVASWNGNPHFSAVAELFVSRSLLSLLQPAFCHIFCPCVLTRWRHNDVRMFAAFLFRTGSHCTTVDLNYGSKNGVSGHLVTLRLPS